MAYDVWYRKRWKWKHIPNVIGDGYVSNESHAAGHYSRSVHDIRFFVLKDKTRIEIPALHYEFKFGPGRHEQVLKQMERETGQKILTEDSDD